MKVLIIHFRSAPASDWQPSHKPSQDDGSDSAGTDGVSLEMMKRRQLLEETGHQVSISSAYEWAEYPIPLLEFDSDDVRQMMRNLFERMADFPDESELGKAFDASKSELKRELNKAIADFSPDLVFVHNILCLPLHPAATVALTEVIRETGLPLAAIHHDILSEGAYKFKPTCGLAKTIIEGYYPPQMPNIRHWTINSRNRKALKGKGVEADIIHDSMDFDERLDPAGHQKLRAELRNKHDIKPSDIVLLVGARIVPNKRIEIAGKLTAILHSRRQEIVGRKLYNGELFTGQGGVILVLAGRPEVAFLDYQQRLFDLFDTLNIDWMYVGDEVRPLRSEEQGFYALYPDMYAMADFVLYPTGWEGFGNQLLEAFAAGLPAAVFEYPVYQEDIGPRGVQIVSLGDTAEEGPDGLMQISQDILDRAAGEMMGILTSPDKYREITDNNIEVGRRHFSFDVLRAHLNDALSWAQSFKA